ncbi:MAG: phosphoribosylamine--glycine ligase, partial [Elusimicrobia bacterium RIFCSPLOWO2_01_FULL_54_10]
NYLKGKPLPIVIKADGLAAGKGVSVCFTHEEAKDAIETMLVKKAFGEAGERILIEDALQGSELSLMALCDGKTIKPLPTARDYKRVLDGNKGPNTGGMGAVSPSPVPPETMVKIDKEIVARFLKGIQQEGLDFRGLIYFGIMLTPQGPKVLEFNVRFGDPETEAVLPLIESDLADAFLAVSSQKLADAPLRFHDGHSVTVVCCSKGYPGKYDSGKEILGLETAASARNAAVFHSGTLRKDGKIYTQGGRVLNCSARGKTFDEARNAAYTLVKKISFDGMHYRSDIGASNAAIPAL